MLRRLADGGAARAATATRSRPRRVERLEFELGVIEEMGFESYFLIVWDFVTLREGERDRGRARAAARPPARSSPTRSSITDLDPLANDLLFERFLNPGRKSMPDIDIDFSVRGRERVIRYVAEKYGRESVAQIITFGKMAPRAATRDAARVLGFDYATGDRLAKLIPEPIMGRSPSFEECLKPGEELKQHLRRRARRAADRRRRPGPRGDRPQQLDPRRRGGDRRPAAAGDRAAAAGRGPRRAGASNGANGKPERQYKIVTQYSMGPIEEIGLLKMDFLGLRNLDVIEDAVDDHRALARRARSTSRTIPLDDAKTYEMLARGDSIGVFQLESEGMRDALQQGQADRVRRHRRARRPLPAGRDALTSPTTRAASATPRSVRYPDPRLRPITEATYGCVIYQEQLMEIAKQMAGFSPAEADDLRKAIGKKKRDLMATMKDKFLEGCAASGTDRQRSPRTSGR